MATLSGNVVSGTSLKTNKGFDTATRLTVQTAQTLANNGYSFCIRYLSRQSGQQSGDLDNTEAGAILLTGLALMAVQHCEGGYWIANGSKGTTYGANAAANAQSIGLPKGVTLWLDLEQVSSSCSSTDIIAYCNNWYDQVNAYGYEPGIYVGANCGLTGTQLYNNLKFQHYWKSMSTVPSIPTRGYQMTQSATTTVGGISIDPDTITADSLGGTPHLIYQPGTSV